jgi:hypothetical protein
MASLLDLAQARLGGLLAPQRPSMAGLLGGRQQTGTLAGALQGYTPPQMTAMTNPQVMDYARNVAQSAQQNLQTQMSDLDKALIMDQGGINVGDRQALARLMEQIPGLMGATAYHGTPHTIKGGFDINKIGTGEGAQVYGHGMYFAENPKVAETYAAVMPTSGSYPSMRRSINGVEVTPGTPEAHAATLLSRNGMTVKKAKDMVQSWIDDPSAMSAGENTVSGWKKTLETLNTIKRKSDVKDIGLGNLYKVDIPDEYIPNMLDWDKPVPEDLRKRISKATMEQFGNGATGTSGEFLYKEIVFEMRRNGSLTPEADAAKWLDSQGVKGIRYEDAGSRGKEGKGTSNFVVFDPTDVKILEKNSQKVEGLLD